MHELIMHEPIMFSYESIMLSYVNLVFGPLRIMNMSVRTVTYSYGVVKATSPVQLKPWTKPAFVAGWYDTRQLACLHT